MNIVLFIDDDESFLQIVNAQLSGNRFRVFTESSGKEGLKVAASLNPDLILCDIHMPGMDGFEVLKHLRRDSITKNIPVIMLTAITNKEAVYKAMRYNIIDYIIKPHTPEQLMEKMNAAILYSNLKKNEKISEKGEHILLSMGIESVIISFKIRLKSGELLTEIKSVFSHFFFKSITNKRCILDLRSLSEFDSDDTKVLELIIKLFGVRELLVIAGRHYGDIVSNIDFDEVSFDDTTHFFISYGDMEIFLHKKPGK